MKDLEHLLELLGKRPPERVRIETTLYDLMEAVMEELDKGEEHLLSRIVCHLMESGRLRWRDGSPAPEVPSEAYLQENRGG